MVIYDKIICKNESYKDKELIQTFYIENEVAGPSFRCILIPCKTH